MIKLCVQIQMRQITAQHVAQTLFEVQLAFILCFQFTFDSPFGDSLTTAKQNQYVIMQANQVLVIIDINCLQLQGGLHAMWILQYKVVQVIKKN